MGRFIVPWRHDRFRQLRVFVEAMPSEEAQDRLLRELGALADKSADLEELTANLGGWSRPMNGGAASRCVSSPRPRGGSRGCRSCRKECLGRSRWI